MKIVIKPYWKREDGFVTTTTALILAGIAIAASAAGAITTGMAQKSAADFNAKVASNNAIASEQQAAANAQLIAQRNRRLHGSQIAALSAAGLDINSDSAQNVMYDSSVKGELDKLNELYKGKVGAANYNAQAAGDRQSGNNYMFAGGIGAGTSILGGLSSMASISARSVNNPNFIE